MSMCKINLIVYPLKQLDFLSLSILIDVSEKNYLFRFPMK